ncbi:NmrA-like family protein-like protein [Lentithecium fluviatile CBS 122367]|uniref:NmrA-like family protein-like protein n=1 Tax=Lentithecium fluviatile CBS 122367 TaxID=1168545 RepID=A0A6G1JJI3_9PLEO|nr:NmrA-like family protein-like protein [Lentithecium fluviatile CBS 122367]
MVNIAVAGGTGNVATEILRAAIASGKHTITILTRSDPSTLSLPSTPGVTYKQVDYTSLASLTAALQKHSVCLSFLVAHLDTDCVAQKNLIHACIAANVPRFAPSEWAIKSHSGCPPYENKDVIAAYLHDLNKDEKKLEYCLFQPSVFMDYFAHPHPLSPALITWPFFIDFENRRAIILDDGHHPIAVTAISDISAMLALALEDARPWPAIGGMRGARTTCAEILTLGERVRGGEWSVEHVRGEDIEKGVLRTSWVPQMSHPVIPTADREQFSKEFVIMFFKGILNGSWDVSEEWNERFPEYGFTGLEEYLEKAWEGRA